MSLDAAIRPSLNISDCAWNASDILVMSPAVDSKSLRVVEVIKGSTEIGAVIGLPELAWADADAYSMAEIVSWFDFSGSRPPRELPNVTVWPAPGMRPSDRIIVFLRRPGVHPEYEPRPDLPASVEGWQPAHSWGEMRTSAVWLQDGVAYGFAQTINPGPSHLTKLRMSEAKIREEIRVTLDLRAKMDRALADPDRASRVRQFAELVRSPNLTTPAYSALRHLESEGGEAVEVLNGLLEDPNLASKYWTIADSLLKTHMPDIHLSRILDRESRYWNQTCPMLSSNWGDQMRPQLNLTPIDHESLAHSLLSGTHRLDLIEDRVAVNMLLQAWKGCPPMYESTPDQLAPEAERLLHAER